VTVGDIEGIVAKAVKAAVQVVREEFQKCFDIIKKDCDDLKSFCSFLKTCIQSLENPDNSATAKEITELSAKADALSSENRRLTIAVNDLDRQGRRHNIRIQGLIVKPGDNCSALVKSLLQTKLNVDMKDDDMISRLYIQYHRDILLFIQELIFVMMNHHLLIPTQF